MIRRKILYGDPNEELTEESALKVMKGLESEGFFDNFPEDSKLENSSVENVKDERKKMEKDFLRSSVLLTANGNSSFSAWIRSDGAVFWVPSGNDHLDVVFQNPSEFNLSSDEVKNYSLKKSDVQDGNLDELYARLYKNGWVRIRNFGKCFFVTCGNINNAIML